MPVARCPTAALRQPSWVACCSWSVVRSRPSPRGTRSFFLAFRARAHPRCGLLITRFSDPHRPLRGPGRRALRPLHRRRLDPHAGRNPAARRLGALQRPGPTARVAPSLPRGRQLTIAALTVGLAVKVPLFPLHLAAVCAHDRPTAGSVLLARAAQDGHLWPRPLPGRARARRLRDHRAGRLPSPPPSRSSGVD